MVHPLHASLAEPHLSVLPVDQAVCGASRGLPEGETGMGCTDGDGEGSESGIDRHPTDEGGSECPFVNNSRKQESFREL